MILNYEKIKKSKKPQAPSSKLDKAWTMGYNGIMKKVKSIKDLEQLMESLGAVKDEEPGFTSWTLDCGPERQAPSSKPQASSSKDQASSTKLDMKDIKW